MDLNRHSRVFPLPLVLLVALATGCEQGEDPSAASTPTQPGGAQSAYGKAQERADRLKGQIDDYQQEVIRQADTVFDSSAPRVGDGNDGTASGE